MGCAVCLQGTQFYVRQWVSNSISQTHRIALTTANTFLETDGVAKLCKFAAVTFEILKEVHPVTFATVGYVNLIAYLKDTAKLCEVFDLNKRWRTWLNDGAPQKWINFISLVCVTAYRALGVVVLGAKLKLFEMANLFASIGSIPVVGKFLIYVTNTVALWFISAFGLCLDTWANINELRDQELQNGAIAAHFDLKKKHISSQIEIYGTIARMVEIQKNLLARRDQAPALGDRYLAQAQTEYDNHGIWLNNLILRSHNAAVAINPAVPAPTPMEQSAFNAIYAQKARVYTLKNGTQEPIQRIMVAVDPHGQPVQVPDHRNFLDLLAAKTTVQWDMVFTGANIQEKAHARKVLNLESQRWSILLNNANVTKAKHYAAIASNIAKIAIIIFNEMGKWALPLVFSTAFAAAVGSTAFMLGFALVVATTAAYKIWVTKKERPELLLTPQQAGVLTQGITALLP